jgi:hypothetical protein
LLPLSVTEVIDTYQPVYFQASEEL